LRSGHGRISPTEAHDTAQDDLSRKRLLQLCACNACTTTFNKIHELVTTQFDLMNTFTVQQLRAVVAQCFDRFSKVAHPAERLPINVEIFQEEWVKHVLWGVAKSQNWKTT